MHTEISCAMKKQDSLGNGFEEFYDAVAERLIICFELHVVAEVTIMQASKCETREVAETANAVRRQERLDTRL